MHDRVAFSLSKEQFTTLLYVWNALPQEEFEDFEEILTKLAIRFGFDTLVEAEAVVFKLEEELACNEEEAK